MPLPTERTITGKYVNPVTGEPYDGTDGDHYVIFEPVPARWTDQENNQILLGGGRVNLDENGEFSENVVCTDAPEVLPEADRLWRLRQYVGGAWAEVQYIAVPEGDGSDLDITDLLSVEVSGTPYVPVEGPVGPTGPAGPQGAEGEPGLDGGLDTGITFGGDISPNGTNPLAVDINPLTGRIVDYSANPPVITPVESDSVITIELDSVAQERSTTWLLMDGDLNVFQQETRPSPEERRNLLVLGFVLQEGGSVVLAQTIPTIIEQPVNQFYDFLDALGSFNMTGNQISPNGANLLLNHSPGQVFSRGWNHFDGTTKTSSPHIVATVGATPASWVHVLRASEITVSGATTTVDVGHYDSSGTLTAVGGDAERSVVHNLWIFPTADGSEIHVLQYGQQVFDTLDEAVQAASTASLAVNPALPGNAVLLARLAVKHSATSLSDETQAQLIHVSAFGGSGGGGGGGGGGDLSDYALLAGAEFTGPIGSVASATENVVQYSRAAGDTQDRWRRLADGRHQWGNGTAPPDAELRRLAAGILAFLDTDLLIGQEDAKAYRLRQSGEALDWDGSGADLFLSIYELVNFAGAQNVYLRLESGVRLAHALGKWIFADTPFGAAVHTLDGAANQLGFHGADPIGQQTVSGERSTGAALQSLLQKLDLLGLVNDTSTAGPVVVETVNGEAGPDVVLDATDVDAIPVAEKGVADGVATLGSDGKVPTAQLPAQAVTSVNGETGAVSLSAADVSAIPAAEKAAANGVATLDGTGKVPSSQLPAGSVMSVNGETGVVVLDAADIGAVDAADLGVADGVATLGPDGKVPSAQLPATSVPVTSVNSETGDVVLSAADVGAVDTDEKGVASGVATLGVDGKVPSGQLPSPLVSSVNSETGAVVLDAADVGAIDADEKGAVNGVASLDSGGKVPSAQLPAAPVTSVNGETGAVSLNAADVSAIAASEKGAANGVATLGADSKVPSAQLPTPPVLSVNGETGTVSLSAADVGAVDVAELGVADGVATLGSDGKVPSGQLPTAPVVSVNGETGAVSLSAADVGAVDSDEKGAASGVATLDAGTKVPVAQIPTLPASQIGSGAFDAARIPDLSATYLTAAQKGAASGVASLGADGIVPAAQLPALMVATVAASNSREAGSADFVCTGTNDHLVIQAAIDLVDAAPGKGTVKLLDGQFNLGATLSIPNDAGLRLIGSGWGTVLKVNNGTNIYAITFAGPGETRAHFADFTIDGNLANQTTGGGGIWAPGAVECVFQNLHITSCYTTGLYLGPQADNAFGHNNYVSQCLFDNAMTSPGAGRGIHTTSNDENFIIGNDFQFLGGVTAQGAGIYDQAGTQTILGCNFVGGGNSMPAIRVQDAQATKITACNFDGVGGDAIFLAASNCLVQGNTIFGIGAIGTAGAYSGVHTEWAATNNNISGNSIASAVANGAARSLIREESIGDSGNNHIVGNTLITNGTLTVGALDLNAPGTVVRSNKGGGAAGDPVVLTASVGAASGVASLGTDSKVPLAQLRQYGYSVLDYGAVGDGTTDDTAEIQAALDAANAAGGGWVYIPGGRTYAVSTFLVVYANTIVWAYGATIKSIGNTGLVRNFLGTDSFAGYAGRSRIQILGGIWDGNAADAGTGTVTATTNVLGFIHASDITVRDATIRNTSSAHALEFNAVDGGRVINCRFEGFKDNSGTRPHSEAVQIDVAKSGSSSIGDFDNTPAKNIVVQNCYFGASSRLPAHGRAVGSHTAVASVHYENIQVIGNRIEGVAHEGIHGYCWRRAVIADNIITGTGLSGIYATLADPATTSTTPHTIAITGNTVEDTTTDSGIRVLGYASYKYPGVDISGNVIRDVTGNAIHVEHCAAPVISGNQADTTSSTGLYAHYSNGATITGNTVTDAGSNGINVSGSVGALVAGNTVDTTASNHGIFVGPGSDAVTDSTDVTVTGNTVLAAASAGIRLSTNAMRCKASGNTIRKNGGSTANGITLASTATGCMVTDNDLSGNSWSGATALSVSTAAPITGPGGMQSVPGSNAADTDLTPLPSLEAAMCPSGRYETTSRLRCGTESAPSSGFLYLCPIWLPKGLVVSNIAFTSGNTAATTPSNYWFILCNSSRVGLARTADQTTAAWAANTTKTLAIAQTTAGSASSYTTTYAGLHYLGFMVAAATPPSIIGEGRLITGGTVSPGLGATNSGQTTPPTVTSSAFTAAAFAGSAILAYGYTS